MHRQIVPGTRTSGDTTSGDTILISRVSGLPALGGEHVQSFAQRLQGRTHFQAAVRYEREVDEAPVPRMCLPGSRSKAPLVFGNRDEMHVTRHQTPCDGLDTEALSVL